MVVATAPGYGPVWKSTPMPPNPESGQPDHIILRPARDYVPIEGRIMTAEGRPVVDAKIRAFTVTYSQDANGTHVPWDSDGRAKPLGPMLLGSLVAEAVTDADGRFRLMGLGRDRLVSLWLNDSHGAYSPRGTARRRRSHVPSPIREMKLKLPTCEAVALVAALKRFKGARAEIR